MKKEIKKIAAMAMAAAMTIGTCIPASAATSLNIDGTITDLTMKIELPANGKMLIQPYKGKQIDTGVMYFKNTEATGGAGETKVSYEMSVIGYSAAVTNADATLDEQIQLKEEMPDTPKLQKIMTPHIQMGQCSVSGAATIATTASLTADAKLTTTEAATFDKSFATTTIDVPVVTVSDTGSISTAAGTYTEITEVNRQTLKVEPQQWAPFRITGTVNAAGEWKVGDGLAIAPIFSVTPVVETYK